MANDKKSGQGAAKAKAPARSRAKKTAAAEPAKVPVAEATVSSTEHQDKESIEEQIRRRAHEISLSHNGPGNPEQDWLQAEHEILGKHSK